MKSIPDARLKEADVAPQIAQAFLASGAQLWRNNQGVAKFGPRWVRYGVCNPGGADHIGFLPVRVTQDMVGHVIAVFCAPESKRPVGGKREEDQIKFRDTVIAAGGIAGFVKSWEEARDMIMNFYARFRK